MSHSVPDPIWPKRWQALRDAIDHALTEHKGTPYHTLLKALDNHGDHWFAYFYKGLGGQLDAYPQNLPPEKIPTFLKEDTEYGPDFVMRAICNHVAFDLELIQRCARQRRGSPAQISTLNLVDAWSTDLLKKFGPSPQDGSPSLLRDIPRVISYFNPNAEIRLIPYANALFLGIPHTAASPHTRRDLLVVPHELGHYFYRHGRLVDKPICETFHNLIDEQDSFLSGWLEELFADVFALAALPNHHLALVHWVFTMIRDNPAATYWQDNQTHPIDAVRMFIYLDPATVTDAEKKAMLKRRGAQNLRKGTSPEEELRRQELRQKIQPITQAIHEKLQTKPRRLFDNLYSLLANPPAIPALPHQPDPVVDPANLFGYLISRSGFGKLLVRLPFKPDRHYAAFQQELHEKYEELRTSSWLLQPDQPPLATPDPLASLKLNPDKISAEAWHKILFDGDWITKGPQTAPPVGAWEDVGVWEDSAIHQ